MWSQCTEEGYQQEGFTQGLGMTWNDQTLRQRAICLVRVCVCVYPTLSRQKATHSWLLEPPCFTVVCLPCEKCVTRQYL